VSKPFKINVTIISNDGISNLKNVALGKIKTLITFWFNSPDESEVFWRGQARRPSKIIEFFVPRDDSYLPPSESGTIQIETLPVVSSLIPNQKALTPSTPQIVFAGDIRIDLRPEVAASLNLKGVSSHKNIEIDDYFWDLANMRLDECGKVYPFTIHEFWRTFPELETRSEGSDLEVLQDGLRLTLHSRERYLYIVRLCESGFADRTIVIGNQWRQFPSVSSRVHHLSRFPESETPGEVQRARVCPDFGSSLGLIPIYMRAQILATKTGGLLQRSSVNGNPFLAGVEESRTFDSFSNFLDKIDQMLSISEQEWLDDASQIRENYNELYDSYRLDFCRKVNEHIE
jgi:hypothetical protein